MSSTYFKWLITAALCLTPFTALAQQHMYFSGLMGLGHTRVSNQDVSAEETLVVGFRGGVLFNQHISVGMHWQRGTHDLKGQDGAFVYVNNIMAEVTYYEADPEQDSLWVSLLFGVAHDQFFDDTDTSLSFGASVGYQFMLTSRLSVSPQLSYQWTASGAGPFNQLSLLANVTAWL